MYRKKIFVHLHISYQYFKVVPISSKRVVRNDAWVPVFRMFFTVRRNTNDALLRVNIHRLNIRLTFHMYSRGHRDQNDDDCQPKDSEDHLGDGNLFGSERRESQTTAPRRTAGGASPQNTTDG